MCIRDSVTIPYKKSVIPYCDFLDSRAKATGAVNTIAVSYTHLDVYKRQAQDCIPMDGVPYIGRYASSTPNLYVATGFNKWGMTSSMVSAMIISSMIAGKECEFAGIFSPQRFNVTAAAANLWKDGMKAAKGILKGKFMIPKEKIAFLPAGQGGIVEYEWQKVGVYKNEAGEVLDVYKRQV